MTRALASFDRVVIINLAERTDRRREVTREIERIGGFDRRIGFFDAIRPPDRGPFRSVGARGCFMSQLGVLREARDAGVQSLLILEDDVDFARDFAASGSGRLARLAGGRCDMLYGAYEVRGGSVLPPEGEPLDPNVELMLACFVGIRGAILGRLVEFLEGLLGREEGSPEFGPMDVDGAYSVFRRLNPDIVTYAAAPQLARQRSSRSDITEHHRFDRIRLLRGPVNLARRLRSAALGRWG